MGPADKGVQVRATRPPRSAGGIVVASALAGLLTGGVLWLLRPPPRPPESDARAALRARLMNPGGGIVRGVSRPRAVPAAQAGLADDAEVIGVVADGRPRAYLLTALGDVSRHVVNDVVGDVPVSVTYCDLTNCVKVFTADTPGRPLALDLGGWRGRMLLHVHGALYEQETGVPTEPRPGKPFPYRALPHTRTTWKAWKRAHPDTDVYRGDDIDAPGGG